MALPIAATGRLIPEQSILAVSRLRKGNARAQITTQAHDKDALTALRHAVVSRVHKLPRDLIGQP